MFQNIIGDGAKISFPFVPLHGIVNIVNDADQPD